mgnify:FL=1
MEGVESAKVFSGKVSLPNSNNVNLSGPLITAAKVFNNNNDVSQQTVETLDLSASTSQQQNTKPLTINELNYDEIEQDGFTAQGYTIADTNSHITSNGKVMITAYNKDGENSRIYIYNSQTGEFEGKIVLDNKDHVGGATFDSKNQILYVTSSEGKVNSYDYKALTSMIDQAKDDFDGPYTVDMTKYDSSIYNIANTIETKPQASSNSITDQDGMDSVFYYDGYLYSCTYAGTGKLIRTKMEIEKDSRTQKITNIIEKETITIDSLPSAVQGIAFCEEDGTDYLVTASSASGMSSRLKIFEISDEGNLIDKGTKVVSHKGLEGIYINDGSITGIFEYDEQELQNLGKVTDLIGSTGGIRNDIALQAAGTFWDVTH